jgi:hypothetical protein
VPNWFFLFIVFDILVTGLVIYLVFRKRFKLSVGVEVKQTAVDFKGLMELTKDEHPRIGEYLRTNWSGDPGQLAPVLTSLLSQLEEKARHRGLTVDRDTLKTVLAASVRNHRMVKGRDLGEALEKVA